MKTNYIKVNMEGLSKLTFIEKAVFSYIASLAKEKGYCFATNEHLCKALSVKDRTMYRILNRLEDSACIRRETKSIGYDGKQRRIFINPTYNPTES
jgi:transcription initiation factor IIE alpha subunit